MTFSINHNYSQVSLWEIMMKICQPDVSQNGSVNTMFLDSISTVASYPGAAFMLLSQVWRVSLHAPRKLC